MSPLDIEIILHHYTTPAPFPRDTDHIRLRRGTFIHEGILRLNARGIFECTERGAAYVRFLCRVPFPTSVTVTRWTFDVDPSNADDDEIEDWGN